MRLKKIHVPVRAQNVMLVAWLVAASPVIVMVIGAVAGLWLKRKAFGPSEHWSSWFAWHPVNVGCSFEPDWRWLEFVERQSSGIMFNTLYRRDGRSLVRDEIAKVEGRK